ncbi:MAG TPA: protease modulator HflC, partial [Cellvibrio sp.]
MSTKGFISLIALIVGLLLAFNSIYVVTEYQRAIMLEFGRLVQADIKPGLHFKKPWAKVSKFDGRLLTADMTP